MSDVEQTSPMVEKDKVPDGTGSDPSNRKKSPLDRIRRPKMGKRIKSVSSAASFPRAILSLWFLAKKKEGGDHSCFFITECVSRCYSKSFF